MAPEQVFTRYAPAERADRETLERQSRILADTALLRQLYDAVSEIVLILNRERQIVFFNRSLALLPGIGDMESVYGLRPGELLGCAHAMEAEGGCGTTEYCSACGAINAILTSQSGSDAARECRIARGPAGDSLELLVKTSPVHAGGHEFTVCALTDISHEKRRRALERTFFHDIMNTAAGVRMLSELLETAEPERLAPLQASVREGVERLVEEICAQRDLAAAESRDLALEIEPLQSVEMIEGVVEHYRYCEPARNKSLVIAAAADDFECRTDRRLLWRILGNMVKNALEASNDAETVTVGCRRTADAAEFWVHNPAFIPRDAQLQIFTRSFSTKGAGRGLGTYGMRLLAERYLGGKVWFETSPEEGTTFRVTIPANGPSPA